LQLYFQVISSWPTCCWTRWRVQRQAVSLPSRLWLMRLALWTLMIFRQVEVGQHSRHTAAARPLTFSSRLISPKLSKVQKNIYNFIVVVQNVVYVGSVECLVKLWVLW